MTIDPASVLASLASVRRVNVTGNAGAGKTTLSRALGSALGRPVVHLDRYIWAPGWHKVDLATRNDLISSAASEPTWVIDGVSAEVRQHADAIVFIDLPTRVVVWRILRRAAHLRRESRPELGPGFPELRALRPALRLARRFNRHIRPALLAELASAPLVVHLTSTAELAILLAEIEAKE